MLRGKYTLQMGSSFVTRCGICACKFILCVQSRIAAKKRSPKITNKKGLFDKCSSSRIKASSDCTKIKAVFISIFLFMVAELEIFCLVKCS